MNLDMGTDHQCLGCHVACGKHLNSSKCLGQSSQKSSRNESPHKIWIRTAVNVPKTDFECEMLMDSASQAWTRRADRHSADYRGFAHTLGEYPRCTRRVDCWVENKFSWCLFLTEVLNQDTSVTLLLFPSVIHILSLSILTGSTLNVRFRILI